MQMTYEGLSAHEHCFQNSIWPWGGEYIHVPPPWVSNLLASGSTSALRRPAPFRGSWVMVTKVTSDEEAEARAVRRLGEAGGGMGGVNLVTSAIPFASWRTVFKR